MKYHFYRTLNRKEFLFVFRPPQKWFLFVIVLFG